MGGGGERGRAGEGRVLGEAADRVAGNFTDTVRIALAQQACTCKRGCLGGVDELKRELAARLERRDPPFLLLQRCVLSRSLRSLRAAPRGAAPSGRCRSAGRPRGRSRGTTGGRGSAASATRGGTGSRRSTDGWPAR